MASIGGIAVYTWKTPIPYSGYEVEDISRSGIDGHEIRVVGMRGKEARIEAEAGYVSDYYRQAGRIAFMSLQGGTWSVVNNHGNTINNILVLGVEIVDEENCAAGTSSYLYRDRIIFTVKNLSTVY